MSKFLVAALMLSLLNHGAGAMNTVSAWDDKDFFRYCPPSRCSKEYGPEIRFPLRLESSNTSSSCGAACTKLACSGQDTILLHPALGRCNVTAIDYKRAVISFVPLVDSSPACPIQKFISKSRPDAVDHRCAYEVEDVAILVGCSRKFTSGTSPAEGYNTADNVVGPISCLSNANQFSYLVNNRLYMSVLPVDCKVASNGVIPLSPSYVVDSTFKQMAERIINFAETTVGWALWDRGEMSYNCRQCEIQGRRCAFSPQRNQTFCEPRGPHGIFIANWPKSYMIAPPLFPNVVLYF